MSIQQVVERSPMRALDQAMQGGLGSGNLGVVFASAGAGKTACLVQIGLDALLRGKTVLHVSSEAPVGHLRSYYDEFFRGIEPPLGAATAPSVLLDLERRRLLISQLGPTLRLERLREAGSVATGALGRDPDVVIVEGFDWEAAMDVHVEELRAFAARTGSELWLSARTHCHATVTHELGVPPPLDRFAQQFNAMLALDVADGRVQLRIIRSHGEADEVPTILEFESGTMRLVDAGQGMNRTDPHNRKLFMLHSGGAKGAEAAFGEVAERYGIAETTFSFEGHGSRVRDRGLRLLTESELRTGDVSLRYVSHHLGREFPSTPLVRKIIQSIWHQIRPCQQVFAIGQIQPFGTVRGGTGWGAELARRWNKELFVFDQKESAWFRWDGASWTMANPVIEAPMFAGIGTAHLENNGRNAIESLFERSFR